MARRRRRGGDGVCSLRGFSSSLSTDHDDDDHTTSRPFGLSIRSATTLFLVHDNRRRRQRAARPPYDANLSPSPRCLQRVARSPLARPPARLSLASADWPSPRRRRPRRRRAACRSRQSARSMTTMMVLRPKMLSGAAAFSSSSFGRRLSLGRCGRRRPKSSGATAVGQQCRVGRPIARRRRSGCGERGAGDWLGRSAGGGRSACFGNASGGPPPSAVVAGCRRCAQRRCQVVLARPTSRIVGRCVLLWLLACASRRASGRTGEWTSERASERRRGREASTSR